MLFQPQRLSRPVSSRPNNNNSPLSVEIDSPDKFKLIPRPGDPGFSPHRVIITPTTKIIKKLNKTAQVTENLKRYQLKYLVDVLVEKGEMLPPGFMDAKTSRIMLEPVMTTSGDVQDRDTALTLTAIKTNSTVPPKLTPIPSLKDEIQHWVRCKVEDLNLTLPDRVPPDELTYQDWLFEHLSHIALDDSHKKSSSEFLLSWKAIIGGGVGDLVDTTHATTSEAVNTNTDTEKKSTTEEAVVADPLPPLPPPKRTNTKKKLGGKRGGGALWKKAARKVALALHHGPEQQQPTTEFGWAGGAFAENSEADTNSAGVSMFVDLNQQSRLNEDDSLVVESQVEQRNSPFENLFQYPLDSVVEPPLLLPSDVLAAISPPLPRMSPPEDKVLPSPVPPPTDTEIINHDVVLPPVPYNTPMPVSPQPPPQPPPVMIPIDAFNGITTTTTPTSASNRRLLQSAAMSPRRQGLWHIHAVPFLELEKAEGAARKIENDAEEVERQKMWISFKHAWRALKDQMDVKGGRWRLNARQTVRPSQVGIC
eukprot:PhF_6_TR22528/c0_g1_i1/m.31980